MKVYTIKSKNIKQILLFFIIISIASVNIGYAEIKNYMEAAIVVGQKDFVSSDPGTSADKLNLHVYVTHIATDGKRLFIPDTNNHRVLIFNNIPTKNGASADVVIGQTDFVSKTFGCSRTKLFRPVAVATNGKQLAIADLGNNRVLIYNKIPTENGAAADVVVGQPDFTSNSPGLAADKLNNPRDVEWIGDKFFIADRNNNRVLIFNKTPTINGAPADVVIGQPDFVSKLTTDKETGLLSSRVLVNPHAIAGANGKLIICDQGNNRVLIFNSIPTTNYASADVVIGQPDFVSRTPNNGGRSARTLYDTNDVLYFGRELFITDDMNGRVLIFKELPRSNFAAADYVLGRPDFTSGPTYTTSARDFKGVMEGIAGNGQQLFIVDESAHRVLIFNIAGPSIELGPQFDQGKAVLGKVFEDKNGNGIQDEGEQGIEGVKVASDTGIYAITDSDGKFHFPYLETGQRLLKVDPVTLPEGSQFTTDNPYHLTVTKGILSKVSFGVKLPEQQANWLTGKPGNQNEPLLEVSITQDPVLLKPRLIVSVLQDKEYLIFNIDCNYFLFIERAKLNLYDQEYNLIKSIELPKPLPSNYRLLLSEFNNLNIFYYQLCVYDKENNEDRTKIGSFRIKN